MTLGYGMNSLADLQSWIDVFGRKGYEIMDESKVALSEVTVEWVDKKDNKIGLKIGGAWYSQFIVSKDGKPNISPEFVETLTSVKKGDVVNLEAVKVGAWWNITTLTVVGHQDKAEKPKFDKSPKGFGKSQEESDRITRMSCIKSAVETIIGSGTAWDITELVDRIIVIAKRYEQFVISGD